MNTVTVQSVSFFIYERYYAKVYFTHLSLLVLRHVRCLLFLSLGLKLQVNEAYGHQFSITQTIASCLVSQK